MDVVVWPTGRTADEQRLWKICGRLRLMGFGPYSPFSALLLLPNCVLMTFLMDFHFYLV